MPEAGVGSVQLCFGDLPAPDTGNGRTWGCLGVPVLGDHRVPPGSPRPPLLNSEHLCPWGATRHTGARSEGLWEATPMCSSLLPSGKNDGSIGGKQYFKCNPGYGLLVRPGRVRRAVGTGRRRSVGLRLQGAPEPRRSSTLSGSATNLASLTAALAKVEGATALRADRSHKNPENRKSWAS